MKEKVHEEGTKAAKTPSMIYWAKLNDNILWTHPWQNACQQRVDDFLSCIIGNLRGNLLQPSINTVLASFLAKRESHTIPAPFRI